MLFKMAAEISRNHLAFQVLKQSSYQQTMTKGGLHLIKLRPWIPPTDIQMTSGKNCHVFSES